MTTIIILYRENTNKNIGLYKRIAVDKVVVSKDGPATVFCNGTLFKIAPGNTLILRKTKAEALN